MVLRSALPSASISARPCFAATTRLARRILPGCAMALGLLAAGVSLAPEAQSQAPVALPTTATLLAGGATSGGTGPSGNVLPASGAPCYTGSPYTAKDANGDGCPGPYATFSSDFRGGLVADGSGNVYVIDTTNNLVRKIDAKSGVISVFAGGGTACAGKLDSAGDGCPLANTTFNVPRGGATDPYGNILIAGYSSATVNVLCTAVSPLCPNTPNHKQVGYMYRVAGCVSAVTSGGTSEAGATPGTDGDGLVAAPYGNLSGDIADWGSGSTGYGTCSASVGSVDQPRSVAADQYGNVYIADSGNGRWRVVAGPATFTLPNGTVLTNPLINILNLNPAYASLTAAAAYGHIYPILGGWASSNNGGTTLPTTAGTACAGGAGGSTLDTLGDGCPYYENNSANSTSIGIAVDPDGNPIFSDVSNKLVRTMLVAGTTMANVVPKANGASFATHLGYVYPLIGLGGEVAAGIGTPDVSISFHPTQGSLTYINTEANKLAIDPVGNLYVSDYSGKIYVFDILTGYVRLIAANGTPCSTTAPDYDPIGDGCSTAVFGTPFPTTSPFSFGTGAGGGIGIAFTPQGDLIIGDNTNLAIRRVTGTNLAPVRVGTSLTQQVTIHAPAGSTGITASLVEPSPDITVGAVTCASAANADTTLDCQVPLTFTPLTPGRRSTTLTVTATGPDTTATFPVTGTATGSALVVDDPSPTVSALGTVISATSLAADGAGNVFTIDTGANAFVEINSAGTSTTLAGTVPSAPYQLAVDSQDNLYASNGTASITKDTLGSAGAYTSTATTYSLPAASYASSPVSFSSSPSIYGVAVDSQGNLYFSDRNNEAVFEVPVGDKAESLNEIVPILTGLTSAGELALDGAGNLLIADTGAGKVYRMLANTAIYPTQTVATVTTFASNVNPTHIAADTAGNLYIQDATAKTVTEVSLSGVTSTAYSTINAPQGITVGSTGELYEAEATLTSVNAIQRNIPAYTFASSSVTLPLSISNTGNLAATGFTSTDSAEFPITPGSSNACGTIPSVGDPLLVGASCTAVAGFAPGNNGNFVSSVTTLLPAASSIGSLTLSGQEPLGVTYTTTTTVTGPSTAVYAASGTEITFTVAEVASNSTSQNGENVNVTIDSGSPAPYALSGDTVSVPVSGLTSGPHTITAVYPGDGTYLTSTGSANFSITQASTSVTWNPSTTTQQYSAAVGAGVLDATANAPGSFIYTATPTGGSAINIHSASYLPVGAYALGVTFVPNDSVDYAQSTGSVASFQVTQATTTAAVAATQMLVAADGTGNYTTVQAAVNALPSGGSVYIKPGTYIGFVTVVQPNLALRGLGGDPTKVILTHEAGAFGSNYPYTGEFQQTGITPGNGGSNGYQLPNGSTIYTGDVGGATLVVEKGINTALSSSTTIPNGFYSESLSLINTYDSDTTNTTTTYETTSNGTCTVNAGPAMTYSALFNTQTLCASQALAIAVTGDLAVFNNVYTTSLQDTIYSASQGSGANGTVPSRQYWFRGKVTGDVDFIFGDGAAVFDHSTIYTAWHGNTATGTETIQAQQKLAQTGSGSDYISGYIMNSDIFTSQSTGMTNLYFGRPYGNYATWVMLNSSVDQVNPLGYTIGLTPPLTDATFTEYNDVPYTDPAPNTPDVNGVLYLGTGGNTGEGVSGTRETASTNPGTAMAGNNPPTSMTLAQAQAYFPTNFLSQTVSSLVSPTQNWNPTAALASEVNAFVPSGTSATVASGSSVTILLRPQTPGLGAIANGTWTIPTGTYTLTDSYNGGASYTLASGNLDASGEAYFTSSTLSSGTHNLTWTYSGDANFAGSTTASAYVLTVTGSTAATTLSLSAAANPITYGQSASITATVATGSGTPTGTVTLNINGVASQTQPLSGGSVTFSVPGLTVANYNISASYSGDSNYAPASTTANLSLGVQPAPLTVIASCANRIFDQPNSCSASVVGNYQYSDSAATVFVGTPTATTTAAPTSPANNYTATPSYTLTAFGSTNYTITPVNGSFTVSGGAPQFILFAPLPNFPSGGTYQLTARASSGLPVSYTVTAGNASVVGSELTVSGPGLVTVQASQSTDPNGDYAAATPVSVSFTAQ